MRQIKKILKSKNFKYSFLPTPPLGQDMTQAEFNRFEFSFPPPRLVATPRLKNVVCPTIYP